MKIVKRIILAIVVIALLKALMLVLDKYSPQSSAFHIPLLSCFQLLVGLWLLIILVLHLFKMEDSWTARFLPVLIALLVLGADVACNYLMSHPGKIPSSALGAFRDYYTKYERNNMWLEPCSVYDSAYYFRLIPGLRFSFGNIEYKNQYAVNSESLRSDEGALSGPQVICAGNSYTFGQGVEQNEAYPSLLSFKTKKLILSTANPSFGTAREVKRFTGLDTSVLKYLVIQYSEEDAAENYLFVQNKGTLPIPSENSFRQARSAYLWAKEYFPGKYAVIIGWDCLKRGWRLLAGDQGWAGTSSGGPVAGAGYFLDVLNSGRQDDSLKIIVTDINRHAGDKSLFLSALDSLLQQSKYAKLKRRIVTVDVGPLLAPEDFYILDPLLKASGHEKVASKIAALIQ